MMTEGGTLVHSTQSFSTGTAAVYIFNLIVGTGALALPAAFSSAGWAAGSVLLLILAIFSFITATWVVESMAACNAIQRIQVESLSWKTTLIVLQLKKVCMTGELWKILE